MSHVCDFCESSKTRRRLADLLTESPNMTTVRAAEKVGVTRTYASQTRLALYSRGCIPGRTKTGSAQSLLERQAGAMRAAALTTGGGPLIPTLVGDVEALAESLAARRVTHGPGYPIGTCHFGKATQRAA